MIFLRSQKKRSPDVYKRQRLGRVSDVIQNTAQDLYEIETDSGKKYLIPAVREFVTEIDINHGIMKIKPIEGLFGDQEEV